MLTRLFLISLVALSLLFVACGSGSEETENASEQTEEQNINEDNSFQQNNGEEMNLNDAMSQMQQMMSGGDKVEPVNFRKLRALLPKEVDGMDGSNFKGEKTGGFGIKVSMASADYDDDNGSMTITITDMGTMKGMMAMASAAWLNAEIDRETENEIEQTFTLKGNKAHKKYNTLRQTGEISTIIGNRFVVNVKGRKVPYERLENALTEVPMGELEDLKNEGVE
ncbi:MAG: hypothetical protein DWQ10_15755 [Calditrichaeota bacterium]|nr:MAG: hypothetical protein DWQ10_15755 [Calditrichota bacterium]